MVGATDSALTTLSFERSPLNHAVILSARAPSVFLDGVPKERSLIFGAELGGGSEESASVSSSAGAGSLVPSSPRFDNSRHYATEDHRVGVDSEDATPTHRDEWDTVWLGRLPAAGEVHRRVPHSYTPTATLFPSIALIPRIACRVRSSFSINENRTCPSP